MQSSRPQEKPMSPPKERRAQKKQKWYKLKQPEEPDGNIGKKFWGTCNQYGKAGHEETRSWKKQPELLLAKFAKSGVAISDNIVVISIMDFEFPTKAEHVFGFKKESHDRNC